MTVAAISEFANNIIFIHFESLCLVTLEVTAISAFSCCLVLGRWKALLISPSLEESSKVSYPSPLLVVDPRWSSLTSLLPLLCSLGVPSSLLSPSSAAFSATLAALATASPLVGGSCCLALPGILTRSPSCVATHHGLNNSSASWNRVKQLLPSYRFNNIHSSCQLPFVCHRWPPPKSAGDDVSAHGSVCGAKSESRLWDFGAVRIQRF